MIFGKQKKVQTSVLQPPTYIWLFCSSLAKKTKFHNSRIFINSVFIWIDPLTAYKPINWEKSPELTEVLEIV